ncbi:hypothetical protein [Actinomadura sp. B10D3]|uniref:hypothetical protein n=1 Tax=Actinomadura sp. B10D3 TaxID=3153557 RepID=UPI00325C95EE
MNSRDTRKGQQFMGMVTYYRIVKDGKPVGDDYDVDTAYYYLSDGLDQLELDGDVLVVGHSNASDDDEVSEDSDGGYSGSISPRLVESGWQELKDLTFEQFLAAFRRSDLGRDYDEKRDRGYLEANFANLKAAYRKAAELGAGIEVDAF